MIKVNPSELWRRNHPWAPLYAFTLGRPPLAVAGGRLLMNTDLRLLYRAIDEIGQLPGGSAVLDVPCVAQATFSPDGSQLDVVMTESHARRLEVADAVISQLKKHDPETLEPRDMISVSVTDVMFGASFRRVRRFFASHLG